MSKYPLLKDLTIEEIATAAERWLALMSVERVVWAARSGFEGDTYPTSHVDERHLTLSMWTRFDAPGHQCNVKTSAESKELLIEFADVMRQILSRSKDEESPEAMPLDKISELIEKVPSSLIKK